MMNKHTDNDVNRRTFLAASGAAIVAATAAPRVAGEGADIRYAPQMRIATGYYQHHDADFSLEVPEEGFGGWNKADLVFSRKHTALVCMHAWDAGTREAYPGWYRAVPYIPRSCSIGRDVFPRLLSITRKTGLTLFHVVGGGDYYKQEPGYQKAVSLAGTPTEEKLKGVTVDESRRQLDRFRHEKVFPGSHNDPDIEKGFSKLGFLPQAVPLPGEGIAENGRQLHALCVEHEINHLVYVGFAINWCLLLSPGGMADMQRYGLLCSTIREATTAVENKETARGELCKREALWRVALNYGFVFDLEPFIAGLEQAE
jgi:hypothetical protein